MGEAKQRKKPRVRVLSDTFVKAYDHYYEHFYTDQPYWPELHFAMSDCFLQHAYHDNSYILVDKTLAKKLEILASDHYRTLIAARRAKYKRDPWK